MMDALTGVHFFYGPVNLGSIPVVTLEFERAANYSQM